MFLCQILVEKCEADSTTTTDLDETIAYSDGDSDSDETIFFVTDSEDSLSEDRQ